MSVFRCDGRRRAVRRIDMDPLSVAASVAGVAAMGLQLSQTIYGLISSFYEAEKEMSSFANDLSLLLMVLNELEGILRRGSRVYRQRMLRVVNDILNTCEGVFQSISIYISPHAQDTTSSKQFQRKVCWYFESQRVRPLQAGLESLRSTLNVVLHVVHLARVIEAAESFLPDAGTVFKHVDVLKDGRILVRVVLENRQGILSLKKIEEDRDRRRNLRNTVEDMRKIESTSSDAALDDRALIVGRSIGPRETMESGRSNSFGGCGGGCGAITGTSTSLFAPIDIATDTTYSNAWTLGGNKTKLQHKIAIDAFDTERSGIFDEEQGDEADKPEPETDLGGESLTTTTTNTMKTHEKRLKDVVDGVSNDSNPIVIDTPLQNTEAAVDDSKSAQGLASTRDMEGTKTKVEKNQRQKEMKNNDRISRSASPGLCIPARSISQSEHVVEVYEASEAGPSGQIPNSLYGRSEPRFTHGADDWPSPSGSLADSLSHSPASVYYSMTPEMPIAHGLKSHHSEEDISGMRQYTASPIGLVEKPSKCQGSLPETEMVWPTAQWFLSVVPHESTITELIVRSRSEEPNYLSARAEETAKTLLLSWTNVDPDLISGEEKYGFWNASEECSRSYGPAREEIVFNQPYQMSYTPQAYPTYTPQPWHPQPVLTAPPAQNERQSDSEELARLKKLILDEKAEQDMRAAAMAAAIPPAAQVAPIATEELLEDNMQHENTFTEALDTMRMQQEHHALWKAEPPRLQPVIMRDWLRRKFIFPVDLCQTWEGLHNLIQEAFGHLHEYKPVIEKGCYNISHVTGEVILPSTWKLFVQPGLEVNMEIWNVFEVDRDESRVKAVVGGRRDKTKPEPLIPPPPPQLPEIPKLGNRMALQYANDDGSSSDDAADDEIDHLFQDGMCYIEQSDPRYLSIENVLLEQKKAKVDAEMKLERNKRFFQLKQQLMEQGAAIQARQDAAEHAEQDTKLAWLEKQVRDQKEELDRLPPLLTTPPGSSAGESMSKSASSPQRKLSFGARLLGRMPSRSLRSKGSIRSQQMITEGC